MTGRRIEPADLANRFTYHPPSPEQVPIYEEVREQGLTFAAWIVAVCPPSREASLAVTAIEEAVMWANAAVARHGKPDDGPDDELAERRERGSS